MKKTSVESEIKEDVMDEKRYCRTEMIKKGKKQTWLLGLLMVAMMGTGLLALGTLTFFITKDSPQSTAQELRSFGVYPTGYKNW